MEFQPGEGITRHEISLLRLPLNWTQEGEASQRGEQRRNCLAGSLTQGLGLRTTLQKEAFTVVGLHLLQQLLGACDKRLGKGDFNATSDWVLCSRSVQTSSSKRGERKARKEEEIEEA